MRAALLEARGLVKRFPARNNLLGRPTEFVHAVDGVSFDIADRETLGLVGESGSGKSTIARVVTRLLEPDQGTVRFGDEDLLAMTGAALRRARRELQMVFQDPRSSIDPLMSVAAVVTEPLRVHTDLSARQRRARAAELLTQVGMPISYLDRRPDELSGGQLQRVAIGRALAVGAKLLVCDEAVSALDVSVQAQVVNLLEDLKEDLGLSYLFIAHDLAVVHQISDRIAVMYLGKIVEHGPADRIWQAPQHPYTEALLSAIPEANPRRQRKRERIVLHGDLPNPADPPSGCRFHTRCPYVMDICRTVPPPLDPTSPDSAVACHLHTTGPVLAGSSVSELQPPDRGASHAPTT
jgi:peptide/nickel transport system ATP-binding protein